MVRYETRQLLSRPVLIGLKCYKVKFIRLNMNKTKRNHMAFLTVFSNNNRKFLRPISMGYLEEIQAILGQSD